MLSISEKWELVNYLEYLLYLVSLDYFEHLVHLAVLAYPYLAYLDYILILAFISYIANLAFSVRSGSLVGSVQLENYLWTQHAVSSSVCLTHYFNIGETGAGACQRHWNHPVYHAQRDKRLSWRIMRLQERRRWRQSMVVHQHNCHEVGNKPINCLGTSWMTSSTKV